VAAVVNNSPALPSGLRREEGAVRDAVTRPSKGFPLGAPELAQEDGTLMAELARQRAKPKKQQQEIAYERQCDSGARTVTEGTILRRLRSMEIPVRSNLSVLGGG
jgi:hypothetical protein